MKSILQHSFFFLLFFSFIINGISQPPISISASIGSYSTISGTILNEASNGEAISTISGLPFNIRYNNTNYTSLYVTTYGTISFNRPYINYIPEFLEPDLDFIAVFWDAFFANESSSPLSKVQYKIDGSPGSQTLTIEWDKVFLPSYDGDGNPIYNSGDEVLSFQVKFFENSENIEFKYKKNNSFSNAYIQGRPVGLQFRNNTYFTVTELSTNASLSQNNTNYIPYINSSNDGLTLLFYPTPTISISAPSASLTTCKGTTSNPTSFSVNGSNLTASVTISAPSNFEISTSSGGSYSSSLTLTNTSTVSETLYVRLNSSATAGSKSGTITATSTDASDATTTVSGTVYELPVITISGTTTDIDLVSLTTSGGTTYAWSDGSSITSTTNTFDASGLYALTVTDANGCISSTLLNITVQHWGLSSSGAKTLDSAIQINRFGKIGSLNPITASGKISEYKQNNNGLVLNLDAGNSSSYSGTGNIWSDLSGNGINATFGLGNQSPTYSENDGGTFIFSSADQQYLTFNQSDLHKLPYGNTPFTMSAWAKSIKTSDNGWGWIIAYGKDAAGSTARFIGSGEGSYSFGGYNFDDVIGDPIPLNEWFNITGTFDGLNAILYVNGIEMQRAEKPNWDAIEDVGYIGNQVNLQNEYWDGAISNIQIYNKALTATEVLNNYNALKSRFSVSTTTVATATNRIWMDRNLGASQVATNSTDALAFGDLYQWGRGTDGHQLRTSSTTSTQSSIDQPGNASFILESGDWRTTNNNNLWQGVNGTNNPCPTGFRIPTKVEWDLESASWSGITDAFNSPLKVTMSGDRRSNDGIGQIVVVGEWGSFWTSTLDGNNARRVYFGSAGKGDDSFIRSWGFSVRCIKD